ncbi:hypothetical protein GCM10008956_39720 [Deinococcus arenae]|uniref:Uncharacterized protein n=1 Tax=Deinococcus arenae TaxID=1452751 RepID=A0A8H9GSM8_9DEIO|nr:MULTISPECIES: hypothetical protein [Deinococcus]GGM60130.1 hypothetical protein GCM10008956_39720 [Deinococcus arenae]
MIITATVPAGSLLGHVTHSDNPRVLTGTEVGFRLADPEGVTELTALTCSQIHKLLLGDDHRLGLT